MACLSVREYVRRLREREIRQKFYLSLCNIWKAARLSLADTEKLPEKGRCWRQKSDLYVTLKNRKTSTLLSNITELWRAFKKFLKEPKVLWVIIKALKYFSSHLYSLLELHIKERVFFIINFLPKYTLMLFRTV